MESREADRLTAEVIGCVIRGSPIDEVRGIDPVVNLLPELSRRMDVPRGVRKWAGQMEQQAAAMTLDWPGRWRQQVTAAVGQRLWFYRPSVWPWQTLATVSSRLGRDLSCRTLAVQAIRHAADLAMEQRAHWLLVVGTAAFEVSHYVARSQGVPRLLVDVSSCHSVLRWLKKLAADSRDSVVHLEQRLMVSPPLADTADRKLLGLPLPDRLLVAAADQLVVAHLRPGGHVWQLLAWRAARETPDKRRHRVAVQVHAPIPDVASGLAAIGYHAWPIDARATGRGGRHAVRKWGKGQRFPPRPGNYLIHWTRASYGPWPDEVREAYLHRLVTGAAAAATPLETLRRIVAQRRLLASSRTVRGGVPAVSFSAIPVARLARQRSFRSHRGTWDAEPYGVAVDREWLVQRGVLPVVYAERPLYEQLAPTDRPFFQMRFSRLASGRVIDWSREQEWRHVGDVDLASVNPRLVFIFVPDAPQARLIHSSPWPIVPLDHLPPSVPYGE